MEAFSFVAVALMYKVLYQGNSFFDTFFEFYKMKRELYGLIVILMSSCATNIFAIKRQDVI